MKSVLRVAARKSDLARLQAYEVGRAIERAHADVQVEYQFSTSLGDLNLHDPLWKMPEKGVFTADLTEKLTRGECDLVVHSWKDLPTEPNPKTEIAATLKRADVRDVILVKGDFIECVGHERRFRVFSSSPRREYNVRDFLRWSLPLNMRPRAIEFLPVRGNIATRARKFLDDRDIDGWVVAKAALDRLLSSIEKETASDSFKPSREILREVLAISQFQVIPISVAPAAPAQGALAIEIARGRDDIRKLLSDIHDIKAWSDVMAEREIFREFGGGCHQKIGITYETRAFGRIECGRGQTDDGKEFSFQRLTHAIGVERLPKSTREQVFPLSHSTGQFFSERRRIPVNTKTLQGHDLFVARADAWPDSEAATLPGRIVWASGVQTWRKLAEHGVWVSGCQDGRGEDEPIQVGCLLGRAPQFLKLTHANGYDSGQWPILATYELVEKSEHDWPDLTNKTHFYWGSFSQFECARRRYSDILARGYHACGPGNTFHLLKRVVPRVSVYLSHESWLEDVLEAGTK